jgi:hypothetical protein
MSDVIVMGSGAAPATRRGRLIFALDATASRRATWDLARDLQAKMFRAAAPVGKLDVQLVYYRGAGEDRECQASKWKSSGEEIVQLMNKIDCIGGMTQIGRVLKHTLRENERAPVQRLVFIGDACEEIGDRYVVADLGLEEEGVNELEVSLVDLAGALGRAGVPIHIFQEGRDPDVMRLFRTLALRSGGEYCEFNPAKLDILAEQLGAVARLAVGDAMAITHKKGRVSYGWQNIR